MDGIEKTNNTVSTINSYTSAQITVNGVDRAIYEIILYNYDIVGYGFESMAVNLSAVYKNDSY